MKKVLSVLLFICFLFSVGFLYSCSVRGEYQKISFGAELGENYDETVTTNTSVELNCLEKIPDKIPVYNITNVTVDRDILNYSVYFLISTVLS